MRGEVLGVGVADVEGAGAVVGVLVGGGAADAEGGVGACYYYYCVFYAAVGVLVGLCDVEVWWRGGGEVRAC